ncbi:MAG: NFACT RNA binding domain-containing protein [Rhodothermales bacterium]|nr:NFACT RNA binding domain-containing protein [Rhodothermales bacterium]
MPRRERPPAADYDTFEADGYEILVGKSARDNDRLTFKVADPQDLWLHVAGTPGSHVVVRNPDGGEVPRAVVKRAAELAAFHSKRRAAGGKVNVHVCRACDVRKPRGAKPGTVQLRRYDEVKVYAPDAV